MSNENHKEVRSGPTNAKESIQDKHMNKNEIKVEKKEKSPLARHSWHSARRAIYMVRRPSVKIRRARLYFHERMLFRVRPAFAQSDF